MLSWKNLTNLDPKNRLILEKLTKKKYDTHCENATADYHTFKTIQIEDELLEGGVERDSYIFGGANFYEGDMQSKLYSESLLKKTDYDNAHPVTQLLNKHFNKTFGHAVRNIQPPGEVVAPHFDLNGDFSNSYGKDFDPDNLCKAMIFLEDWKLGQMITFGKSSITNWKKHDCCTFNWYIPHATANASTFYRPILAYIGI